MIPTTVQCLKGRIAELGPSLERAPEGYRYVGRRLTMGGWRLPQSDWANPTTIKQAGSAQAAVGCYAAWMAEAAQAGLRSRVSRELRGAVLLCWCRDSEACHARWLAHAADHGIPGVQPSAVDLEPWTDYLGRVDDISPRRAARWQDVTPVGQWAGAL